MVNLGEWLEEDEASEAAEAENQQPQPNGATVPNGTPDFVTIHGDGDGPLDRLAEAAEWEDILIYGAQWATAKPPDRETLKAFKRPGGTYDISAKVLKANPHVLVVHSDATGLPYGKGQKLTKGRVYAHLHYGGDLKAAAQALAPGAAVGLPAHVVDAVRARDHVLANVTEVTADQISGDEWENSNGTQSAEYTWTDDGNALKLVAERGHLVRRVADMKRWFVWDGCRWALDHEDRAIREAARDLARLLPSGTKEASRFKHNSMSATGVSSCVRLAETDTRVSILAANLDSHPELINTPSGVVDLRTGTVKLHDPDLLLTRITAYGVDLAAPASALGCLPR